MSVQRSAIWRNGVGQQPQVVREAEESTHKSLRLCFRVERVDLKDLGRLRVAEAGPRRAGVDKGGGSLDGADESLREQSQPTCAKDAAKATDKRPTSQ